MTIIKMMIKQPIAKVGAKKAVRTELMVLDLVSAVSLVLAKLSITLMIESAMLLEKVEASLKAVCIVPTSPKMVPTELLRVTKLS